MLRSHFIQEGYYPNGMRKPDLIVPHSTIATCSILCYDFSTATTNRNQNYLK